jgi:hypothetical protein
MLGFSSEDVSPAAPLRLWLLLCLRLRGARQHGQGGEDNTGGKSAEDGTEKAAHDRGPRIVF